MIVVIVKYEPWLPWVRVFELEQIRVDAAPLAQNAKVATKESIHVKSVKIMVMGNAVAGLTSSAQTVT